MLGGFTRNMKRYGINVYVGSATYYASQLVQRLEETINLCKSIRDNDKEDSKVRMEASQTMCIAEAQLYKIMESGPTFWPTLPVFPKNHQPELTDNDTTLSNCLTN